VTILAETSFVDVHGLSGLLVVESGHLSPDVPHFLRVEVGRINTIASREHAAQVIACEFHKSMGLRGVHLSTLSCTKQNKTKKKSSTKKAEIIIIIKKMPTRPSGIDAIS